MGRNQKHERARNCLTGLRGDTSTYYVNGRNAALAIGYSLVGCLGHLFLSSNHKNSLLCLTAHNLVLHEVLQQGHHVVFCPRFH